MIAGTYLKIGRTEVLGTYAKHKRNVEALISPGN